MDGYLSVIPGPLLKTYMKLYLNFIKVFIIYLPI